MCQQTRHTGKQKIACIIPKCRVPDVSFSFSVLNLLRHTKAIGWKSASGCSEWKNKWLQNQVFVSVQWKEEANVESQKTLKQHEPHAAWRERGPQSKTPRSAFLAVGVGHNLQRSMGLLKKTPPQKTALSCKCALYIYSCRLHMQVRGKRNWMTSFLRRTGKFEQNGNQNSQCHSRVLLCALVKLRLTLSAEEPLLLTDGCHLLDSDLLTGSSGASRFLDRMMAIARLCASSLLLIGWSSITRFSSICSFPTWILGFSSSSAGGAGGHWILPTLMTLERPSLPRIVKGSSASRSCSLGIGGGGGGAGIDTVNGSVLSAPVGGCLSWWGGGGGGGGGGGDGDIWDSLSPLGMCFTSSLNLTLESFTAWPFISAVLLLYKVGENCCETAFSYFPFRVPTPPGLVSSISPAADLWDGADTFGFGGTAGDTGPGLAGRNSNSNVFPTRGVDPGKSRNMTMKAPGPQTLCGNAIFLVFIHIRRKGKLAPHRHHSRWSASWP